MLCDVTPFVSIIVPCYNVGQYIEETIRSLLVQTYRRFEIIAVDDGSTDDTLNKLKAFSDSITILRSTNRGGCFARNYGFQNSSGDLICFFDADDLASPWKLERQVASLVQNDADVVDAWQVCFCGKPYSFNELEISGSCSQFSGMEYLRTRLIRQITKPEEFNGLGIPDIRRSYPNCWLLRRTVCERAGLWDERLVIAQDTEYFNRVLLHAGKVALCNYIVAQYRLRHDGVSKSRSRLAIESLFRFCELCEEILKVENSEDLRSGVALRYGDFVLNCYQERDLREKALMRIEALGGYPYHLAPKRRLSPLVRVLGLKRSAQLRHWF